jgi:hypothetical protein
MNTRFSPTLFFLLLLVGCGEAAPYRLVNVEGLITLDGKPLPQAIVTFQPIAPAGSESAGPGSAGRTDAEGRYVLETVRTDEPGAVVGPHRIIIMPIKFGNNPAPDLPARYNSETTLTLEVGAEGTQSADFQLTSDP